jgi:DNA mismatch repair protein MutL
VELSPVDFQRAMELKEELHGLGFQFDAIGTNSILIQGIPADFPEMEEQNLFKGLFEDLNKEKSHPGQSFREPVMRFLASRYAGSAVRQMQSEEMESILAQLFSCEIPGYAPDGRPIIKNFGLEAMANWFQK